nr:MAG TPA: hypothetical protein [Bacteriophage sp.]
MHFNYNIILQLSNIYSSYFLFIQYILYCNKKHCFKYIYT